MKDDSVTPEQHPNDTASWTFRVDKENFTVDHPDYTGREVLEKAGKTPVEQYILILSGHGHPREIGLDEPVDLSVPGVEQFRTIPRECREGQAPRRDFRLPAEDETFLDQLGYVWETVRADNVMRVIIRDYPITAGYNCTRIDLNLRIEPTYPDTELDMVYVHPPLSLVSGRGIKNLSSDTFDGKSWQRWSRHRQPSAAWRPGMDGIETHLALVDSWFAKEAYREAC